MHILSRRAFGAMTLGALAVTPLSASAQDASKRKINVSGRQRMLSQRMAMSAFMARAEIAPESHLDIMTAAYADFDKALAGLRNGDADLGLPVEDHPSVLAALDNVDQLWSLYGASIEKIASDGGVNRQEMGNLVTLNMKVLTNANIVVKRLVKVYGGTGDTTQESANAVDISGRQRMLSQKMVKEAALIGLKYQRADNRVALGETIELFDNSLFALMYGDSSMGLMPAPPTVLPKLQEVEALWLDSYAILQDVADSGKADTFDLQAIALNRDQLLKTSNEAVSLFEQA